jgi:hypothetical protein
MIKTASVLLELGSFGVEGKNYKRDPGILRVRVWGVGELDINVRSDPRLAIISLVHGHFIHSRVNIST